MRIGIIALLQESNTFIGQPTTLAHFEQELLATGEAVRERLAGTHHEVAGMFHALDDAGEEAVPIFAARAVPFGVIQAAAIERLLATMFAELEKVGQLDGILVAPHGATVSQTYSDVDGHWLGELRRRVAPGAPIIGTLDPHANLSPAMVQAATALIAYRTNPHLDQRARGIDAARMMIDTVRGKLRPTMAAAFPPLAINIEKQHTAEEPCHSAYRFADEQLANDKLLMNSIVLGFPYSDVPEMGSSAIAVTDDDPQLAQQLANELAGYLWKHREAFAGDFISIDEALDKAAGLRGPVCLLDMGDNVGGGSPGDATPLALAIHKRQLPKTFVCICDAEAVAQAQAAGEWGTCRFHVGGQGDKTGPPLECEATVLGLYDGRFEEPQPRHGGFTQMDQGSTAVIRTDHGLTIMLTSRRTPPFSLRQLTAHGILPEDFHLLVAKGVNAPVAAYKEVCKHFIRVNTPGCTTADIERLTYKHRRKQMFPWERDADFRF
ncbi:MAG: M81 family metallopeptidase [Planctomycetia bacterium]|jgi:microcystin degradation protein MlrC|nr:M81 family metallopeptidase [Planctomycetia bacterium]